MKKKLVAVGGAMVVGAGSAMASTNIVTDLQEAVTGKIADVTPAIVTCILASFSVYMIFRTYRWMKGAVR